MAYGLRLALSGQGWCSAEILLSTLALAITVAADGQRVGMMSQTIQGSTGQQVIVKDLSPLFEGTIAGDDDRGPLVAFADDLVQVLGGLGSQWIKAKVVEDQQVGLEDLVPQAGVTAAGLGSVKVL